MAKQLTALTDIAKNFEGFRGIRFLNKDVSVGIVADDLSKLFETQVLLRLEIFDPELFWTKESEKFFSDTLPDLGFGVWLETSHLRGKYSVIKIQMSDQSPYCISNQLKE